ncbi:MAG: hypothetical protein NTX72_03210 [Candidatus Uhrbacteria bacterium]|nr:hypothetical protein [Candidatus Uhrbacteria bacterium]
MKHLTLMILAAILFVGLTYAGKSLFGMDDGMQMGNIECVNHCIDTSVFPSVPSTALPVLLFVLVFLAREILRCAQNDTSGRFNTAQYVRLTEPIRLSLRGNTFSPVMIRD